VGNSSAFPTRTSSKFLFVGNLGSSGVSTFTIHASTGKRTQVSGLSFSAALAPASVTVDSLGKLIYVSNQLSKSLSAFTLDTSGGVLTPATNETWHTNILTEGSHSLTAKYLGHTNLASTSPVVVQVVKAAAPLLPSPAIGELSLTSTNSYANPFDVTLSAAFTDGTSNYKFWGFYAGADEWKIRYDLPAGTWNYTVSSSDSQLNGKSGAVSVMAPTNRLMISGRAFKWSNTGKLYFIVGLTAYDLLHQNIPWRQVLDFAQANGFNHIRVDLNTGDTSVGGLNDMWLNGGTPGRPDFSRFSIPQWDKIDAVLRDGLARGLTFEICPGMATQFPLASAERQRFIRYLVARLGAYPHIIFAEEFDLWGPVRGGVTVSQDEIKSIMADFSAAFLAYPYKPPMSLHMRRNDTYHEGSTDSLYYHYGSMGLPADFRGQTWLTFGTLHERWMMEGLGILRHSLYFTMPMYTGETIYEATDSTLQYPHHAELDEAGIRNEIVNNPRFYYRRYTWSVLLSGGMGVTYGLSGASVYRDNTDCSISRWSSGLPASADGLNGAVGYQDIKRAVDYFSAQAIDPNQLIPDDRRINNGFSTYSSDVLSPALGIKRAKFAQIVAKNEFYAYNPYSTNLTIMGIPAGLSIQAIDPKTGNAFDEGATDGGTSFAKPSQFSGDYVLHIFGSAPPASGYQRDRRYCAWEDECPVDHH
jgi:hypothetical protein